MRSCLLLVSSSVEHVEPVLVGLAQMQHFVNVETDFDCPLEQSYCAPNDSLRN